MIKMICFDMDGTIADLYAAENWLSRLRTYDPAPYAEAAPMWDMASLAAILGQLTAQGIEIRIITWLSKETTPEYDAAVRLAKREWLMKFGFPADKIHLVQYGATKANSVRKRLAGGGSAVLFDDSEKVRSGWTLGETIDPTACDLLEILKNLLD
jgi:hypothetical protein